MNKLYYSYEMCKEDTQKLVDISKSFQADAFLSVARGGLTLSHLMSQAMNQRDVFTINSISYDRKNQKDSIEIFNIPDLKSYKKVLIIDDIVDSGKTMIEIFKILNEKFPNTPCGSTKCFWARWSNPNPGTPTELTGFTVF